MSLVQDDQSVWSTRDDPPEVRFSNLKLVPQRKGSKPVTDRMLAAVEFKPWDHSDKDDVDKGSFPTSETMQALGDWCRIANALMFNSKAELMKWADDGHGVEEIYLELVDTAEFLKALALMTEAAHIRVLVAMTAAQGRRRASGQPATVA
jgi:hypothetical protein